MKFSNDFIFGGATAAYQCEGATKEDGKGLVCWDVYYKETDGYNPDPASDFYHKYKEDIDNCVKFGINGIRVSIAWTRIFPKGYGEINELGVKHYHELFKYAIENGVEPLVTLHHFDTPYELNKNGDFTNREVQNYFIEYAKFCLNEFSEVTHWATFNEIWPWSVNQYITGTFPPGEKYQYNKTVECIHGMLYSHAVIVNYFNDNNINGEIGVIHSLESHYPYKKNDPSSVEAAKRVDAIANGLALEASFEGKYSQETLGRVNHILVTNGFEEFNPDPSDIEEMKRACDRIDFLGINSYSAHWHKDYEGENFHHHNGTGDRGTFKSALKGMSEEIKPEGLPRTDWDWIIYPQGLYDMIMRVSEYKNCKKIYITENGMGIKEELNENNTVEDDQRIDYVKDHLEVVLKANENGANVKGYYLWSLMDMFSWSNGYNKRYGFFFVDFDNQKRYPKKSAYWFKNLSETKELK